MVASPETCSALLPLPITRMIVGVLLVRTQGPSTVVLKRRLECTALPCA